MIVLKGKTITDRQFRQMVKLAVDVRPTCGDEIVDLTLPECYMCVEGLENPEGQAYIRIEVRDDNRFWATYTGDLSRRAA